MSGPGPVPWLAGEDAEGCGATFETGVAVEGALAAGAAGGAAICWGANGSEDAARSTNGVAAGMLCGAKGIPCDGACALMGIGGMVWCATLPTGTGCEDIGPEEVGMT